MLPSRRSGSDGGFAHDPRTARHNTADPMRGFIPGRLATVCRSPDRRSRWIRIPRSTVSAICPDYHNLVSSMSTRTLRVATYNIHRCRGLDGRTRPDRIAAVLQSVEADVVGLPEVVGAGPRDGGR